MAVNQFINRTGQRWSSLPTARKFAAVAGVAVVVTGLLALGLWLGGAKYSPLFSDLPADEAGAVVTQLEEMKVPYKISGQGDTILVPDNVLYETRLKLASAGVLNGSGKGFELFDQTQLGTTDFQNRLNYQRALQEELRRTIVGLEEVQNARVHLVLPDDSVFIKEKTPASASVVLDLKPLVQLQPDQVKGIIYLISSSVENLPPENVNVIDTQGNILSEGVVSADNDVQGGEVRGEQLQLKREFEKGLEQRVQKMLEAIVGSGKTAVMITANLNFDQRTVTRIDYGDTGVVRSEQLVEKDSSDSSSDGGVPGSATNIGTYSGTDAAGQTGQKETDVTRNYEIDQVQENTVYAPGQLESLSASVAVDGQMDANSVDEIKNIVEAAIGYQPERGDQISVVSRTFDKTYIEEAQAEMDAAQAEQEQKDRIQSYIVWGASGLGAVLLIIFAIVFLRRLSRRPRTYPMPLSEIAVAEEEPQDTERDVRTQEEKERRDKVKDVASNNPGETASLIRAWLSED